MISRDQFNYSGGGGNALPWDDLLCEEGKDLTVLGWGEPHLAKRPFSFFFFFFPRLLP